MDPTFDLDREEHDRQHAREHQGIDEPRGPEEKRELNDRLRFKKEEGSSHEEEIDIARHGFVRATRRPHADE